MKNANPKLASNNSSTIISNQNCTDIITKVFLADGYPQRNPVSSGQTELNADTLPKGLFYASKFDEQKVRDSPKIEKEANDTKKLEESPQRRQGNQQSKITHQGDRSKSKKLDKIAKLA